MQFNRVKKKDPTEEILANIAECSKIAGRRLATYWAVLLYGVITLAGMSDKEIFLNTGARLPLVNVSIPLTYFWLLFPLFVLVLFLLFAAQLFHLKELRKALHKSVRADTIRQYPWFWNIGNRRRGVIVWLIRWIMMVVIWLSALLAIDFNVVICKRMGNEAIIKFAGFYAIVVVLIVSILITQLFSSPFRRLSKSYWAKMWSVFDDVSNATIVAFVLFAILALADTAVTKQYARESLDVSYQVLVEKPLYDHPNAFWVDLTGRDYEGANLTSSVLRRAKLDSASFCDAILTNATLDLSSLINAHLEHAIAHDVHLEHSNLSYAHLNSADFREAHLEHADLTRAHLDSADLYKAYLDSTNLTEARGLTIDQLKQVWTLHRAIGLDSAIHDSLRRCCRYLLEDPNIIDRKQYPPFGNATWQ